MKIIKKENISIQQISEYLEKSVVVYPSDTVYGLGCFVSNEMAVERVRLIKDKDKGKALLVLIASWQMLDDLCDVTSAQMVWLKEKWPGPVTAILPAKHSVPAGLNPNGRTVAVRWPDNRWLEGIIKVRNIPIVSTSCNISGQEVVTRVDNLASYFTKERPDVVIDAGELSGNASEIYDLTEEKIKKIR